MKISFETSGEADMLRRLRALAELPGLDLALDDAARAAARSARTTLQKAGEIDIANTVSVAADADGNRVISADHARAWYAEHGTLRRPALRWLETATRTGTEHLRAALDGLLTRSVRKIASRGDVNG